MKCRISAGAATLLFSAILVFGQEKVTIIADSIFGPATQKGCGILGGFSDTDPADSLIAPLKLKFQRGDINEVTSSHNRCESYGAAQEISTAAYGAGFGGRPSSSNWASWEKYHKDLVTTILSKNWKNMSYSFWNDADWPGQWSDFFEAWKRAYFAVKSVDSTIVTVGPNTSWGPVNNCWWYQGSVRTSQDYTYYVRQFLDYCITNKCLPDIVALHDWSDDGSNVVKCWSELRNYEIGKGIKPIPFEEDDMGGPNNGSILFKPAIFLSYFANVERTDIIRCARCWWNNDSHQLDGLITPPRKRSIWWMVKAYADITGNIVTVTPGASVDGVAGIDSTLPVVRAVLGRYKSATGPVSIDFNGLNKKYTNATVTTIRIPNTDGGELKSPTKKPDQTIPVADGRISVTINDLNFGDAYQVIVTLTDPVSIAPPVIVSQSSKPAQFFKASDRGIYISARGNWELSLSTLSGIAVVRIQGLGTKQIGFPYLPAGCYLALLKTGRISESMRVMLSPAAL